MDKLLEATDGLSEGPTPEAFQRLRARPKETRWMMFLKTFHEHPIFFSDSRLYQTCDGRKVLDGWKGCVGFSKCGLGYRCTKKGCDWDSCLACVAQADSTLRADRTRE